MTTFDAKGAGRGAEPTDTESSPRPKAAAPERRWFTKEGEAVHGPYEAASVASLVESGGLEPSVLVRAEDETEWRPLYEVDAFLMSSLEAPATLTRARGWPDRSFLIGFVAGFVGSGLGAALVYMLTRKPETRRGAWYGLVTSSVIGLLCRLAC